MWCVANACQVANGRSASAECNHFNAMQLRPPPLHIASLLVQQNGRTVNWQRFKGTWPVRE